METNCDKIKFFQIAASHMRVGEIEMPVLFGLDQHGQVWVKRLVSDEYEEEPWSKLKMPEGNTQ